MSAGLRFKVRHWTLAARLEGSHVDSSVQLTPTFFLLFLTSTASLFICLQRYRANTLLSRRSHNTNYILFAAFAQSCGSQSPLKQRLHMSTNTQRSHNTQRMLVSEINDNN